MIPSIRRIALASPNLLGLASLTLAATLTLTPRVSANPGDLYVTDLSNGSVVRYSPDGTPNTFATGLVSPQGIAFDPAKNLYVADAGDSAPGNGIIYKYDLAGNRSVFLTGLNNPAGIDRDGSDLLIAENGSDDILRAPLNGISSPTVFQPVVVAPLGLASQAIAEMGLFRYIAHGNFVLRVSPPDGTTTDINVGEGTRGVALDGAGRAFVSTDSGNIGVIAVDSTTINPFVSGFMQPTGMDFRPAKFGGDLDRVGFLYVADTAAGEISQISGDGVASTFVAAAGSPNYMVFEGNSASVLPEGKALNISTRVDVETGDNVAIGGFIIDGGTTPKNLIIRAIGPSLANADTPVSGPLSDTVLELHRPNGTIVKNDDWKNNSAEDQAIITANHLAKFNGKPISDLESILFVTLNPRDPALAGSGQFTAVVHGKNGATGVGLVEIYDLDDPLAEAELANISTRGIVGTADNVLIGGVIIGPLGGTTVANASVVVRAIGPSLADATPSVADALDDPFLELRNGDGDLIAMNDNWMDGDEAAQIEDLGLAPAKGKEAAIFANLVAGNYTAIVMGNDAAVGVALVEVYHVPTPTVE